MTVTAIADSCIGDDQVWPPGFRFHPTDEELVLYYLKRKICKKKLKLDIIRDTDVYKWDPEELPAQSILKSGDRQWFFFTPRDRKYTNGARANRATEHGYWKATGKDRAVTCDSRTVGVKKTLVFYRGRAPSGERTDWVMHEYTLDEEELKRCQNVKEYYALYKLYKKSGPGPKNGEQYGAPFKEEEWDDEYVSNPVVTITPVKPPNEANSGYNVKANDQVRCLSNDDGEYIRQLINESALPLPEGHFGYVLPTVVGNGGTQSTMMDPSLRDFLFRESRVVHHDQASFEFTQPPTSQLKLHESPEVTSVPGHFEQVPEFCELDYLEIDDLSSSQLLNSNVVEPVVNGQQFNELDGPSEVDVYHDTVDFPQGTGPIDQGTVPFSYENMINHVSYPLESQSNISLMDQHLQSQTNINFMDRQFQHHSNINLMNQQLPHQFNALGDNQQSQSQFNAFGDNQHLQPQSNALGDNMLNQVGYQYPSFPNINLMDQQWIPYSTTDQVDDQLQFQSVGNELDQHLHMDQINGSLWAHDQSANVFTASGSNLGNVLPIAGLENNGIDQDQGDKSGDGGGGGSRFSSAMWSILESIPTTPASASEGPLVNQAIERMSRLRLNARITDISAVNGAATAKRTVRNSGFFFISMLGASCAILWFLIGNGLGSKENLLMKKFF